MEYPKQNENTPSVSPHDASAQQDTYGSDSSIRPNGQKGFFGEIVRFSILAILIVIPIRLFIAQPFIVNGASMEPTFLNGQYLIVDQLTYAFEAPTRGSVIIFKYPEDPSKFFIKRVIGLPGETVRLRGKDVIIENNEHPSGFILDEPYLEEARRDSASSEVRLGDDEYFVMGDNRVESSDSRVWGPLPTDMIIGRAFLRLLPLSETDLFPGNYADTYEISNL